MLLLRLLLWALHRGQGQCRRREQRRGVFRLLVLQRLFVVGKVLLVRGGKEKEGEMREKKR